MSRLRSTAIQAAGTAPGQALAELLRVNPDELEQFRRAHPAFLDGPAEQSRHDFDVLARRHVRREPDVLEDVPDRAPQVEHIALAHLHAVHLDAAGARLDEAVDHLEGRRLAAARGAEEHERLSAADLEAHVAHRARGASVERLGQFGKQYHSRTASVGRDGCSKSMGCAVGYS